MSLSSLKKNVTPADHNRRQKVPCSAEQFIAQAELYAQGVRDIHGVHHAHTHELEQPSHNTPTGNNVVPIGISTAPKVELHLVESTPQLPYRRATFTLSEPCIDALRQQATQHGLNKSQLVRTLIRHFAGVDDELQQQIIQQGQVSQQQ